MRAVLFATLLATPVAAEELAIAPFGSLFPDNGSTNVDQSIGQKGIFLAFVPSGGGVYAAGDPALPLQLGAANVQIAVGANPAMVCTLNDLTPAAGQCGFAASDGFFSNGVEESLQIALGDFVPLNTVVSLTLGNITSSIPGDTPFSLGSWTFTTRTTPIIRDPLHLELVLDTSGSMNWTAVPGAPAGAPLRREAMREGVTPLFSLLGQYGQASDRVGTVYFNSTGTAFAPGGADNTLGVLAGAADPMRDDILSTYGAPTGGATSIGDGLDKAVSAGFNTIAPPPAGPVNRVILLMSDGEQNTNPMVSVPGGTLQVGGINYPSDVTIYPITAGRMLAPGYALQADIATAAGGAAPLHVEDTADTIPAADFQTYFVQNLADELIGDKVEMVHDETGKMASGQRVEIAVPVTADDVALSFFFSVNDLVEPGSQLRPQAQLFSPDGTEVPLRRFLQRAGNHISAKVPLPALGRSGFIKNPGDWRLVFFGDLGDVTYHAMIMLDSTMIWSEFALDGAIRPTGAPIHIQASFTEGDAPVKNMETVATVRGPKVGIGDFVSGAKVDFGEQTGGEPYKGWQAKLQAVLDDPELGKVLREVGEDAIKLLDNGNMANGDAVAGDGIYSGYYFDTMVEGNYAIDITARGVDRANDVFRRVRSLTTRTVPVPDLSASTLKVFDLSENADGSADAVIAIRLLDKFGSLVGLGYADGALQAVPDRGRVDRLIDRLDGSYEAHLTLPPLPSGEPALSGPPVRLKIATLGQTAFDVVFKELGDGSARGVKPRGDGKKPHGHRDKWHGDHRAFAKLCRGLIDTLWLMSEHSARAYLSHDGASAKDIEALFRDAIRRSGDPDQQKLLKALLDRVLKALDE